MSELSRFWPDQWELVVSGVNLSTRRPDSPVPEGHDTEQGARRAFRDMQRVGGVRYTAAIILPPVSVGGDPIYLIRPI